MTRQRKNKEFSMEILFNLDHHDKPLQYPTVLAESFKIMVWYTPNENSFQAQQNFLIKTKDLNDEAFNTCCEIMGIDKDYVLCNEDVGIIDKEIRQLKPNDCPFKLIVNYDSKELSKTQWFLRRLRNSVSHGRFSIIDNYFVGFDCKGKNYNLFIKIPITSLYAVLLSLCDKKYSFTEESKKYFTGYFSERIVLDSLKKMNEFDRIETPNSLKIGEYEIRYDLITRNIPLNLIIGFKIKTVNKLSSNIRLLKTINHYNELNKNILTMGLIICSHKVRNDNNIKELNQQKIIILDPYGLKCLVKGIDVITNQIRSSMER